MALLTESRELLNNGVEPNADRAVQLEAVGMITYAGESPLMMEHMGEGSSRGLVGLIFRRVKQG